MMFRICLLVMLDLTLQRVENGRNVMKHFKVMCTLYFGLLNVGIMSHFLSIFFSFMNYSRKKHSLNQLNISFLALLHE